MKLIKELNERIGIDKTVLSKFRIIRIEFNKLLSHHNVEIDADGTAFYWLEDGNCFRWLKITDHKKFGVLCAGIKVKDGLIQEFSRMDIFVKPCELGNLQNMTVEEYKNTVADVIKYLEDEYGIFIARKTIEIKEMEINCTIVLDDEFRNYHRVLQLMMFLLPKSYQKLMQVAGVDMQNGRIDAETFYRGNNWMGIKVYDKRKHLEQTSNIVLNEEVMRIELTLKVYPKVKSVFKSNRVWDLTDKKINDFYWKEFKRLIINPYRRWQKDRGKELRKLIITHKERSIKLWKSNLLAECSNREQLDQVPWLLDVDDLLVQVKALEEGTHYNRVKKGIIKACKSNDVYLRNDASKMEEIIFKVHAAYQKFELSSASIQGKKPIHGKTA